MLWNSGRSLDKEVPHAIVTGKCGKGKSFLGNDLLLEFLRIRERPSTFDVRDAQRTAPLSSSSEVRNAG